MDATAKKLLTEIKAKKYSPVYLLQGEETYYIDLISNYIESNVLSEVEKGFNQVILYGKESPVNVILNNAKRFPMMADRQVVIVREAQEIPDLAKEMGQKLLIDYFTRPVPSTILVLCHKYKTLDKRKELGKKADQLVNSSTFKKPYENQLPEFVDEYIRSKGHGMEDGGVQILCESVGNDLNRLANEIDKMLIGKPSGSPITADNVMSQVGMSREYNIFELQKALIAQDVFKTYQIADYFASNTRKNPLIMLVAFLFSFYSKLLLAAASSGNSEKELISILKISPFAARDYMNALRKYSLPKIMENIALLKEADLKLKGVNSGSEDEGQILKELVVRLIH
jgi:DNA polymerase III subunit delta